MSRARGSAFALGGSVDELRGDVGHAEACLVSQ